LGSWAGRSQAPCSSSACSSTTPAACAALASPPPPRLARRRHTAHPPAPPAPAQDYFELGVILTRKRLYTQATKNLEKAKKLWDGEESELAQVHNALGFCYFNMDKVRR
jgi:hypothetical protein